MTLKTRILRAVTPLRPSESKRMRAFTLIETALALLAIGLGLLALFGLGRIGLQTAKESTNDTRCEQMADAIFETLREQNMRFIDQARTNLLSSTWRQQWQNVLDNTQQIPFPVVANMSTSPKLPLKFFTTLAPAYEESELFLLDWNPRYELAVTFSGNSYVSLDVNLLNVTLAIYPDGDTYSSEQRLFHTTLTNTGGLP